MLDAHFAGAMIVSVAITLIVLTGLIQALRLVRLTMLHRTLRRVIDAGMPLEIDLLDRALGHRSTVERALSDVRNGSLLIALAVACALFGWIQADAAIGRLAIGVGAFPLLVGLLMTAWGVVTLAAGVIDGVLDDAALNARAAAGDRKAFSLLVIRYEARLRGFLRKIASPFEADDLAQDTFVRAWERASQFEAGGSYAAWLTRIGWRLFLDERRRATARARRHMAATEHLPLSEAHGGDIGLDLAAALTRLDPQARAAIALCDGQGWTHEEAATMLDLPVGTVKSLIARGKVRLRAFLTTGDETV